MENVKTTLQKAESICNGFILNFHSYSKIYTFTTENISGYIDYFDFNNRSLLTVGSSGDQILNAYFNGAKDITLFDINEYAMHYVYLKIAAIMTLNYEEFTLFFFKYYNNYFNKEMFSKILFSKIYPTLLQINYEAAYFFNELFNTYDPHIIRTHLFDDCENRSTVIKGFNNYLKDEQSYNKLKKLLNDISFKYINGNIFSDEIHGTYDNIFLSNLCTTTSIEEFKELIKRIDENNLNSNGSMLLGYLWDTKFNSNRYLKTWKDIYKMPIVRDRLREFITEAHQIQSDRGIIWNEFEPNDLVLIYRKK